MAPPWVNDPLTAAAGGLSVPRYLTTQHGGGTALLPPSINDCSTFHTTTRLVLQCRGAVGNQGCDRAARESCEGWRGRGPAGKARSGAATLCSHKRCTLRPRLLAGKLKGRQAHSQAVRACAGGHLAR